jgi:predicted PurR-regulated permease PerM
MPSADKMPPALPLLSARWTHYLPHLIVLLVVGWLVYLLRPILMPFVLSSALAYLGDPLVDKFEERGLSRTFGVSVVFAFFTLLFIAVAIIFIPALAAQAADLAKGLPAAIEALQLQAIPILAERFDVHMEKLDRAQLQALLSDNLAYARQAFGVVVSWVTHSSGNAIALVTNLALVPVVTFYLLRDWDVLLAKIRDLLPRDIEPTISGQAKEADDVLSAFIRGQLLVMTVLAVIYCAGLWFADLEYALLIGLLAGLVSFVPYLGGIVGITVAGLAMWIQTGTPIDVLWVFAVFGVGQVVESMILTPLLVGDRIGLHPVAVIFAILAGGQLFGFFGVLTALPVAAVVAVVVRHIHSYYKYSDMYAGFGIERSDESFERDRSPIAEAPVGKTDSADL